MANIIVAIICNLVAVGILLSGVFSARTNGIKVTLVKLFLTAGGLVGSYFMTPFLADKLYGVDGIPQLMNKLTISVGSVNSCIFMLFFMITYAVTIVVCSIVRHALIKKLQNKKLNRAKMKRARSINPHAEKQAARAEWKALRAKYAEKRRWYHSLISGFVGAIIAAAVGIVTLMPYGFIAKEFDDKAFLTDGYKYTLNGVIGDEFADWAVHADMTLPSDEPTTDAPAEDTESEPEVTEQN